MKNSISYYLLILVFLSIGCSTSKEPLVKRNQDSEDRIAHYHVKALAVEGAKYGSLIDHHFREIESLDLQFVKIHYNRNDAIKYDCEVDILFDALTIGDQESSDNKHFSKTVQGQQPRSENDEGPTTYSETVRGYVHQRKKERKLSWDIVVKTRSESNNCKLTGNSFTEKLISKSVQNSLSGDERAIPKKYKEPLGQPLQSEKDMTEEAIVRVYKKVVDQLKSSH